MPKFYKYKLKIANKLEGKLCLDIIYLNLTHAKIINKNRYIII